MFSLSTTYQQAQENLDKFLTQIETENSIGIITRQGHKDIAFLPAEELTSLLETIYLLRSPANAKRLFDALQRSLERDINPPPSETIIKDIRNGKQQDINISNYLKIIKA